MSEYKTTTEIKEIPDINYDIRDAPKWLTEGHLYKSILEQVDEEDESTYFIPVRPEFATILEQINNIIELKIVIGTMRFWGLEVVPYFVYDYLFNNKTSYFHFKEQSQYSAFAGEICICSFMEIKDGLLTIELNPVISYSFNDFLRELTKTGLLNLLNYIETIVQHEIKWSNAFESIFYKIIKNNYVSCLQRIINSQYLQNLLPRGMTGQFWAIEQTIICSSLDCLKIMLDLFDLKIFYPRDIIICSIEKGSYDCFTYLYEYYETKNLNLPVNIHYLNLHYLNFQEDTKFMYNAINYGRIDIIKYLLNKGEVIRRYHLILSTNKSFNTFEFCLNNSTINEEIDRYLMCCAVAKNTHLNELKALVEKGYPVNNGTFYNFVIVTCQLDVLKYLDSIGNYADEYTKHAIKLIDTPANREKYKNVDEIIDYLKSTHSLNL